MILVPGKARILHGFHLRVAVQKLRHRQCRLGVPLHPQVQRLEPQVDIEGILRRLHTAKVPHELGRGFGDIGATLTEFFGVHHPVVAFVGCGQAGEAVILRPVEVSAVNDRPADARPVSVHVFGRGMRHDICPVFDRPAENRGRKGVVDHQGNPAVMCRSGPGFDVQHRECGIGNGFPEDRLCIGTDRRPDFFIRAVGRQERHIHAHAFHGRADEIEGSAVDRTGRHDVVPRTGDVEQRHEVCGLSRGCQHGRRSALQGADLRRHGVIGGILEPGIEIAFGFQVKELSHVLAGVIAERRALHNGNLPGFSVPWAIARLYTFGALSHICILPVLCSCADACSQARKIKT